MREEEERAGVRTGELTRHDVPVLEDDNNVKSLGGEAGALEVHVLNVSNGDHERGRLGQIYESVRGGLDEYHFPVDVGLEPRLAEGHVNVERKVVVRSHLF